MVPLEVLVGVTMSSNGSNLLEAPAAPRADALLEGWRDALGHALAQERKQWQRERMLIEAQAQATVAELRAGIAELRAEALRKVEDVLSGVRPPERGEAGPVGPPGPAGARGEPGEPAHLPPELAEQVRDAIRLLYAPTPFPALTAAQSGNGIMQRPSRIERDDSGGYSLVYDDDEPQA